MYLVIFLLVVSFIASCVYYVYFYPIVARKKMEVLGKMEENIEEVEVEKKERRNRGDVG